MMEKLIKYKIHGINENCFFDMQMGHSSLDSENGVMRLRKTIAMWRRKRRFTSSGSYQENGGE